MLKNPPQIPRTRYPSLVSFLPQNLSGAGLLQRFCRTIFDPAVRFFASRNYNWVRIAEMRLPLVYESVKLPIYYRPVKVKLKSPAQIEVADGTSLPREPMFKTYDSFQIAFYEAGRWRTVRTPA